MPTMKIERGDKLHRKLTTKLSSYIKMAEKEQEKQHDKWRKAEEAVLAYLPETAADAKRAQRRENGEPVYTTIVVPYTYGTVMTMHTYLTSVFFGRSPIHQFVGQHGETEQQTQAVEALIGSQVEGGNMLGHYYIWLYDAIKYGVGVIGEYWEDERIQFSMIEEAPDSLTGEMTKTQTTREIPGYSGNKLENISPYNFLPDPRFPVGRFQEGEFCAIRKDISWNTVVRRARAGMYMNVDEIKGSTSSSKGTQAETHGSPALERPTTYFLDDIGQDDKPTSHPAIVRIYEIYVDLIPSEWGLGSSAYPEKWVFSLLGDKSLLIGVQPLGAMHGQFPFAVTETEIEGYGTWNRGVPEIAQGLQQTIDWLLNTHFFNIRQVMNNQFIIDPSRVVMKDVGKGGPGFVWRARPEAYGTDMRTVAHQLPVQDVTGVHVNDMDRIFGIGERTLGINAAMMGAGGEDGGRKTATQIRTDTGFGVNRLKAIAEFISGTAFKQHARRLLINSQQNFTAQQKLRIIGDLIQEAGPRFINVDPSSIAGSFEFIPVDGTLPVDRFAQATLWKDIMAQLPRIPQIAMSYDIGRIFAWVAQLIGLKNINRFKIQMQSPEQIAMAVQQGNLLPQGPAPSTGRSSAMAGISAAGTVPALPSPGV